MKINLFDFDKTIYDGDSSVDFFLFCLKNKPYIIISLPRMLFAYIMYAFHIIDKTKMKEHIFSYLRFIKNTDQLVKLFWEKKYTNIKEFYLRRDHQDDVIISASPEFLLASIAKELKVKKLIGSKVDIKSGRFEGLNCHDEEKVRRLNEVYKEYKVMESYSDSLSDLPFLKLAENAYIVKKDKITRTDFQNYQIK